MEEKCPKCGSPVVTAVTKSGKKMKKCSTNTWNNELKKAEGCDFIEWLGGNTESLDEDCPLCGNKLVLYTTAIGKRLKKCSTSGWDSEKREATGCKYVEWLKPGESPKDNTPTDSEPLPSDPNA
jgi:hypothetical protein